MNTYNNYELNLIFQSEYINGDDKNISINNSNFIIIINTLEYIYNNVSKDFCKRYCNWKLILTWESQNLNYITLEPQNLWCFDRWKIWIDELIIKGKTIINSSYDISFKLEIYNGWLILEEYDFEENKVISYNKIEYFDTFLEQIYRNIIINNNLKDFVKNKYFENNKWLYNYIMWQISSDYRVNITR